MPIHLTTTHPDNDIHVVQATSEHIKDEEVCFEESFVLNISMMNLSDTASSKTNTSFLLDAISKDKIHLTRFILDALDGEIIDSKAEGTQTPLISAVLLRDHQARSKFVNLLLQRGASVNCPDECGRTPLSYACEMGHLDAVKILLKNSADPEMADGWGNTALMYAAAAGHSDVVEFLVRAFKRLGLQIERQNKVGNSAVQVAKYLGHTKCLRALVSNFRKGYDDDDDDVSEKLSTVNINENTEKFLQSLQVYRRKNHHSTASGETSFEDEARLSISLGHRRSVVLWNRIQSMDSIEEYEKESDVLSSSASQSLVFSGVLTPKPPQKLSLNLKHGEQLSSIKSLPSLFRSSEQSNAMFYSPRPLKTPSRTCVSPSGPLAILLTPIAKSVREELDQLEKTKKLAFDSPIRRFDDSYYQKRCSLPTSSLAPPTAERLMSLRWSRTVLKTAENLQAAAVPQTTLTSLSSKLLRRFTFPEFKKNSRASQMGASEATGRSIPRSESFPLTKNHPQIGSKPSVDSISAVKCEFDFPNKAEETR